MNDRALYSITEAREHLGGISRNTIYPLLNSGELGISTENAVNTPHAGRHPLIQRLAGLRRRRPVLPL
jgi:hypothetical protein